jgi:hypothetical protein
LLDHVSCGSLGLSPVRWSLAASRLRVPLGAGEQRNPAEEVRDQGVSKSFGPGLAADELAI